MVGVTGDADRDELPEVDADGIEEEENRAIIPRVARRPVAPTKAELEEHFPLHLEYREWCEHCVAGKGMSAQHRQHIGEKEELGFTIDVDYAFMTPEKEDDDMCPVVAAWDGAHFGMWVMETDQKRAHGRLGEVPQRQIGRIGI